MGRNFPWKKEQGKKELERKGWKCPKVSQYVQNIVRELKR